MPTYISSWLKTHYPAEFIAGLLTHDPGMYPRRLLVADARRFGVPILPIDVNHSDKVYRAEWVPVAQAEDVPAGATLGVRLAFSEVREISSAEIDSMLAAREDGPFTSLEDLWRRVTIARPVLENLVHIGALDAIAGTRSRRELLWRAVDLASEPRPEIGSQLTLGLDEPITESLPGLTAYTEFEETEAEIEISGIDARRHVMELYRPLLAELGCIPADRLSSIRNRTDVWVAGVKVASQTPAIRSGPADHLRHDRRPHRPDRRHGLRASPGIVRADRLPLVAAAVPRGDPQTRGSVFGPPDRCPQRRE